jgi:hypothetical protein
LTVLSSNLVPVPPVQLSRGESVLDESLEKDLLTFTLSKGRHVLVFSGRHCPRGARKNVRNPGVAHLTA